MVRVAGQFSKDLVEATLGNAQLAPLNGGVARSP
jgi:hypothetical protein